MIIIYKIISEHDYIYYIFKDVFNNIIMIQIANNKNPEREIDLYIKYCEAIRK